MTALIKKQTTLPFKAKLLSAGEGRNPFPLAGGWLVGQPPDKTKEAQSAQPGSLRTMGHGSLKCKSYLPKEERSGEEQNQIALL